MASPAAAARLRRRNSGCKRVMILSSAAGGALADGCNMETSTVDELAGQAAQWFDDAPILGGNWETPCDLWPAIGPGIPGDRQRRRPDPITPLADSENLVDALGSTIWVATLLTSRRKVHGPMPIRCSSITQTWTQRCFEQTPPLRSNCSSTTWAQPSYDRASRRRPIDHELDRCGHD